MARGGKAVFLRGGPPVHPYVYSKRILRTSGGVEDGDLVEIRTREGRPCGYGFAHRSSLIALRVLSTDPALRPDATWLAQRLDAARALREDTLRLPEVTDAWRCVHAEADGLSGLIVDRYGDGAVASLFSRGWHRWWPEIESVLCDALGVKRIIPRVDARTAQHEGFDIAAPRRADLVTVHEHGVRFGVDLAGGHKTGFFLDQRDNRSWVASVAEGRRLFDGMTYTGGFALRAAAAGATSVHAADLDEEAIAHAQRNAKANELDVRFEHRDVFDVLRGYVSRPERERPEVVVLDPPKWAKSRDGLGPARFRYRDLNRLGFEAVAPGGLVVTHSCSGLLAEEDFLTVLREAAREAQRDVQVVRFAGAAPDHPVALAFPEGRYLKSIALRVD